MKILKILFVLISIIFTNVYPFPKSDRNPGPYSDYDAGSLRVGSSSALSRGARNAALRRRILRQAASTPGQTRIEPFLRPRIKYEDKENLRKLNLENADEIIKRIEALSNNEIDLSNLGINDDQLKIIVGYIKKVKKLNLSSNYLTFLPSNFEELVNLEYLDLSNNNLKYFNEKFSNFKPGNNSFEMLVNFSNLVYLNLENNKLEYIPYNFQKGLNPEIQLNVKNNPLKRFAYQFLPESYNELLVD